jgi:ABC-type glycerol-3-phosphate transport system substrate-binding protein
MKRPKLTILLLALALVLAACNPGATSPPGGGGQPSGVTPSGPAPTTGIIPGY